MQRKNTKIWITLLVGPILLLIISSVLQVFARFAIGGSANDTGAILIVINIFSLLAGIVAVIGLMGTPVWIIMLVLAYSHNNKLHQTTQAQPSMPVTQQNSEHVPPPQQPL